MRIGFAANRGFRPAMVDAALEQLFCGNDLGRSFARSLFEALVDGDLDEPAMSAMFIALRLKGEARDELIGAAEALRAADMDFPRPSYLFADCCGTGGDNIGTANVSTAAAFVAAACGLPIAKHGNRSFSSSCGSADVLEALGVKLDITPARARHLLDALRFCFLFAPHYHPGLRHAAPVRRLLRVRTIMNLLGPCLNPAEPQVQLLGIANPNQLNSIAETLVALGVEQALVVHGSGLDEVALHAPTQAVRITDGHMEQIKLTPEQAGFELGSIEELRGGKTVEESAALLKSILGGYAPDAYSRFVAINAGALLWTAGLAPTFRDGSRLALQVVMSGKPLLLLEEYAELSQLS